MVKVCHVNDQKANLFYFRVKANLICPINYKTNMSYFNQHVILSACLKKMFQKTYEAFSCLWANGSFGLNASAS